ncbi:pentatricopeptide repeat-containing protein [Tripterygium wilfordii]|uniref:Pentatricopeptide repeat-containing protein n=1 Tax=Tripterygium wilfordii TaxID=458696 RepID=A0A7J7CPE0_TRIWF|nr:pentatricopeptide repeat-containing protein [Tripterygium wilfordii]
MAIHLAIRRSRLSSFSFAVRSRSHPFCFVFGFGNIYSSNGTLAKTLSTSAFPNQYPPPQTPHQPQYHQQQPPPSDPNLYRDHQRSPNQWAPQHQSQGQGYQPQHGYNRPDVYPSQQHGYNNPQRQVQNPNQWNHQINPNQAPPPPQRQSQGQSYQPQPGYNQNNLADSYSSQRHEYGNPQAQVQNPIQRNNQINPNQAQNVNAAPPPPPPSIVDLVRFCQVEKIKEAIEVMDKGVKADANCFYTLFELCGKSKQLEDAKKVHDYFLQSTFRSDLQLNNKVLEMYGKCGSMTDARRVFDHMPSRDMDSWHLMIKGYADNALGDEGLEMFEQMRNLGLKPNEQTFLLVLSACASADAIDEGFIHFESMKNDYGISPRMEHYLGIIDVLGKSGHIYEVKEYIEKLPFEPTLEIWEALRNYARIHGDVDLEDHAEELVIALDPSKADPKKISTPLPKKYTLISMLEGKHRISEANECPCLSYICWRELTFSLYKFLKEIEKNGLHFTVTETCDAEVSKRHQCFMNGDDSWPGYERDHCYPLLVRITR